MVLEQAATASIRSTFVSFNAAVSACAMLSCPKDDFTPSSVMESWSQEHQEHVPEVKRFNIGTCPLVFLLLAGNE